MAEGRYFTEPVQWSVDNSITGRPGVCFYPDRTVTRGEAARWLWVMQDRPEAPAHTFTDVDESAAVSWMVHAGVTTGTSATTFSPDDPLTRAQIAAFLWRLANEPEAPAHTFNDVHSSWQQGPVSWMSHRNITTGTSATTFSPDDPLTRALLVTFLWRYQNRPAVTIHPHAPVCPTPATVTEYTCPGTTRDGGNQRLPDGALHCTDGTVNVESWYTADGRVGNDNYYLNGELHRVNRYYRDGTVNTEEYRRSGEYHRDDGPAQISYYRDGSVAREAYWLNGDLRRDDGPAQITYYPDGTVDTEHYWLDGDLRRVVRYYPDGTVNQEDYWRSGERHRDDGPALILNYRDGTVWAEHYYRNGEEHRDDGPAYISYYSDGTVNVEEYWLNGEEHREIGYNKDGTVKSDTGS